MSQLGSGVVLFAAIVAVLLFAIRGFRPLSRSGGGAKAHKWSFLRRYAPRTPSAKLMAGLPTAWAVGEITAPAVVSLGASFVLGAIFGVLSCKESTREIVASIVGAVGLTLAVRELLQIQSATGRDRTVLIGATLLACVIGLGFGLLAARRKLYVPLTLMAGVEVMIFGLQLRSAGAIRPTVIEMALTALASIPGAVLLVSLSPELVLPLLGLALVVAQFAVASGAIHGASIQHAEAILATAAGFVVIGSVVSALIRD